MAARDPTPGFRSGPRASCPLGPPWPPAPSPGTLGQRGESVSVCAFLSRVNINRQLLRSRTALKVPLGTISPWLRDLGGSHIRDPETGRETEEEGHAAGAEPRWLFKMRASEQAPQTSRGPGAPCLLLHPAPALSTRASAFPIPSSPTLTSWNREKEGRGGINWGYLTYCQPLPPSVLGDLCGICLIIPAWLSPPNPHLGRPSPSFCVGNGNSHCPRKKVFVFVSFV